MKYIILATSLLLAYNFGVVIGEAPPKANKISIESKDLFISDCVSLENESPDIQSKKWDPKSDNYVILEIVDVSDFNYFMNFVHPLSLKGKHLVLSKSLVNTTFKVKECSSYALYSKDR